MELFSLHKGLYWGLNYATNRTPKSTVKGPLVRLRLTIASACTRILRV